MSDLELPIRAACETAAVHGVSADRCEILQNGNTLVLRLTETLVARVVTDLGGPRQGTEWFARENAVACYLAGAGAPVIPMHPAIPPGPHERLGYPINFWQYVSRVGEEPVPQDVGRSLYRCHELLRSYPEPLPELAILTESLALLETLQRSELFPPETLRLLRDKLTSALEALRRFPVQALHGDAHPGNLMNTTLGLLWTDWEDTFAGPVEWDLASIIWNARILGEDRQAADEILSAYRAEGGEVNTEALDHCMVARAAVMSAWYPILYPDPSSGRRAKLQSRLDWLARS